MDILNRVPVLQLVTKWRADDADYQTFKISHMIGDRRGLRTGMDLRAQTETLLSSTMAHLSRDGHHTFEVKAQGEIGPPYVGSQLRNSGMWLSGYRAFTSTSLSM
ncbi:hypothetical protein H0H92_009734, partial [Tricholoma furcatifolium]